MRIRFLRGVAGQNFSYRKGQEIDLPFHIANEFLHSNNAIVIDDNLPTGLNEPIKKEPVGKEPVIKTTIIKNKVVTREPVKKEIVKRKPRKRKVK